MCVFFVLFFAYPSFHSYLSCISGYSPYASFPSKALAANLVSDLSSSSPLDLGNCFHYAWQAVLLTVPSGSYWVYSAGQLDHVSPAGSQTRQDFILAFILRLKVKSGHCHPVCPSHSTITHILLPLLLPLPFPLLVSLLCLSHIHLWK